MIEEDGVKGTCSNPTSSTIDVGKLDHPKGSWARI
jgi:hypothetical protein